MGHEGKVIITCAVTGAIHTPSMSPHLPVTADEIADAAVGAAEAGAAIRPEARPLATQPNSQAAGFPDRARNQKPQTSRFPKEVKDEWPVRARR